MAVKTFTSGEVLTAADTNTYLNNGGLVYITQATLSNSASYDFTSIFSSTYNAYRLVATNAFTTTAATHVQFQMLSGTTPLTTNTYFTQRLYAQGATVGASGTGATAVGQGSLAYLDNGTNGGYVVDIFNPFTTTETNTISQVVYQYAGIETHMSKVNNTLSYDGLRIKTGSNAQWATIRIYGYRIG